MKIKSLKINAFGNLKEKEIEFKDYINIVQGKNESGKSTLLKFITNIFYGTSKNKKGKEFSDYDRYKPRTNEEFSGKLSYTLDDGKSYEVFRDFNKKNPKIYNENLEDISKEFTIDKTYGNQFFIEQTNVDETMFYSSLVSMQQEVKLDKNVQNTMVQKVANLAGTGDDSVSYKKAIEKINKKQVEEIGTARSQGRPINIVKDEKFKLQDEIGELEEFKIRKKEIEEEKKDKDKQLANIEKTLDLIKRVRNVKEKQKLEEEKIKLSESLIENQEERKQELKKEKEEILNQFETIKSKKEEKNKVSFVKRNTIFILFIIGIITEIINLILIKNNIITIILALEVIITFILLLLENKKQNKIKKKQKEIQQQEEIEQEEVQRNLSKIDAEIKVLQSNIEEQEKQIEETKKEIEYSNNVEKEKVKNELTENVILEGLFKISNIDFELQKVEEEKNHKKLEYHSLELEENTINPKLEKIALLEEKLESLNKREEELEKDNQAIECAKEMLEIAYQKMKQNVTPKLTEELSKNIQKISNGKYTKINLHEEDGMIIEKNNGEYIEAEKLSVGTIDQLYLSLRLAIAKELCRESMPIILDEAFAYYDDERLENILKYLNEECKDNQIIIFTCTNREKEILNKLNIQYQNVQL